MLCRAGGHEVNSLTSRRAMWCCGGRHEVYLIAWCHAISELVAWCRAVLCRMRCYAVGHACGVQGRVVPTVLLRGQSLLAWFHVKRCRVAFREVRFCYLMQCGMFSFS